MEYNVYYEGGSNLIFYSNDGGYGTIGTTDANKVTCTFSDLPDGIWIDAAINLGVGNIYRAFFRVDASDPPVVQEFYSYDNPDLNVIDAPGWYGGDNGFYPVNPSENANFSGNGLNLKSIPLLDNQGRYVRYSLYYDTPSTLSVGVSTDETNAFDIMSRVPVVFSTLPGRPYFPQTTFKARRPMSSSELLALQRTKIEKTLTIPPSINLQDSSEVTARIRKGASVMKTAYLPGQPTKGNSGNMVKFNDSSVVQAMLEGNAYRAAACNYQPRQQRLSWLRGTIPDDQITYPKAIVSAYQISNAAPRVVGFNPVLEFGWRKNDNKAVFLNPPQVAIPVTADFSYENVNDRVASCSVTVGSPVILMTNLSVEDPVTSIQVVGYNSSWSEGEPGQYYIYVFGVTLPYGGAPELFPFTLLINDGKYTTSGSVAITAHAGAPASTAQLFDSNYCPTVTGGSLYFPASSAYSYMCAGSNSDFYVPSGTDFTFMWWQNLTNNTASPCIFDMGQGNGQTIGVSIETGGAELRLSYGGGSAQVQFSSTVNDTYWHHIAMIRYNNVITIYRDGVSNATFYYSGEFGSTNSNALFILGKRRDSQYLNDLANGYITEFVFDNGLARYLEDFTPPTTVTADPSYTVLLLNVSSLALAGKDDSGRNHNFSFYADVSSNAPGFAPRLDVG
jgi:hypothetical protein